MHTCAVVSEALQLVHHDTHRWEVRNKDQEEFSFSYSETSDISHLHNFHTSTNSSVCRATIFDIWEIPLQIPYLL